MPGFLVSCRARGDLLLCFVFAVFPCMISPFNIKSFSLCGMYSLGTRYTACSLLSVYIQISLFFHRRVV